MSLCFIIFIFISLNRVICKQPSAGFHNAHPLLTRNSVAIRRWFSCTLGHPKAAIQTVYVQASMEGSVWRLVGLIPPWPGLLHVYVFVDGHEELWKIHCPSWHHAQSVYGTEQEFNKCFCIIGLKVSRRKFYLLYQQWIHSLGQEGVEQFERWIIILNLIQKKHMVKYVLLFSETGCLSGRWQS